MKPKDFTPPHRIEQSYYREIKSLLSKYLNLDDEAPPDFVIHALSNLSKSPAVLTDIATRTAARMVTMMRVDGAKSWREAARQSSRGREIYELLQREMRGNVGGRVRELVAENARLIGSIPEKVREHVNLEIASMEQQGQRPELIAQYLRRRIPQLTRHQAALVARTETGKAATALTRARSEDIGIDFYQWQTSRDQRVRESHRLMQGVLVRWDDPPNPENLAHEKNHHGPYNAGNIYNCRCDSYPLISLAQITFPARVYTSGSIVRMTRGQFIEFSGINRRVAA